MGLFQETVGRLVFEVKSVLDDATRSFGEVELKMDLFLAQREKGSVIENGRIPQASKDDSCDEWASDWTVKYYVRLEYPSGKTGFEWYHSLANAQKTADRAKKDPRFTRVIGPYKLPTGKGERFE